MRPRLLGMEARTVSKRWWAPVPESSREPSTWSAMVLMAATVLGEAEGEDTIGKRAVAYVIINRVRDPKGRWPIDPAEVCLQRLQFSCWNVGSPRIPTMFRPQAHVSEATWNDCFRVSMEAMFNLEPDPTNGATAYLNEKETRKIRGGELPKWFDESKVTLRLGAHTFLAI